ncbi:MAG: class I SAM-dependent methyltransferase [Steroidobacteraceae bacterium]
MTDAVYTKSWEQAVCWLRDQPEQRELVRANYYDDPLAEAAARYWRSAEWSEIRSFMGNPAGKKALDVGAGRGIASFALAKDGFSVTALEPDVSELVGAGAIRRLGCEQHLSIAVSNQAAELLPFPEGTFDLAFGRAVLHHAHDLPATCRELYRVLKPGGTFIAVREHVISHERDLPRFLDAHPLHRLYGGENAYRMEIYADAIRKAGFRLERILAPLQSPINFAPHSIDGLQHELARRGSLGVPMIAAMWRRLMRSKLLWTGAQPLLEFLDNRPGRLYSFVARKPARHRSCRS